MSGFRPVPLLALLLILPPRTLAQCMTAPVPLAARVAHAPAIALGRVGAGEPFRDPRTGDIHTLHRVAVIAWLKGANRAAELAVITPGGFLDDAGMIVHPALQLAPGDEGIFLLDAEDPAREHRTLRAARRALRQSFTYADAQGFLKLQAGRYHDLHFPPRDEAEALGEIERLTGERARTPDGSRFFPRTADRPPSDEILPITGFSPNPTNGGTIAPGDFITLTGSGFGASAGTVFFTNADDGGATFTATGVASDNVSWSDTSITVKVAPNAGTGPINVNGAMTSGSNLTVNYGHLALNSTFSGFATSTRQRYHLRNRNGAGGMTFQYNTTSGFSANAPAVASFERALATWRCSGLINFTRTRTATATGFAADGVNIVIFDGTLPAGVLGRATSRFNGSATGACSLANTVWWLNEVDLQFYTDPPSPGFPWEYGPAAPSFSEYDFESVSAHELGHSLGLSHRIAAGQMMNFAIANGSQARTPAVNEIAGASAKLAYSTPATCFNPTNSGTPMVALTAGNCAFVDDPLDADDDDDGVADGADCAPANGSVWAAPAAPVSTLALAKPAVGLAWSAPANPGTGAPSYDLVRSATPNGFATGSCLAANQTATGFSDGTSGALSRFYLVRVENACGSRMGTDSGGTPISAPACP